MKSSCLERIFKITPEIAQQETLDQVIYTIRTRVKKREPYI